MFGIRLRWLIVALLLFGAWRYFSSSEVESAPGQIAPRAPIQSRASPSTPISLGAYTLEPLANYEIEARVLSRESYRHGREAELSPLDLALGWGAMSDSAVIGQLSISQGGRFYFYRWQDQPPIASDQIAEHSANTHLIPANDQVQNALDAVRVGQVVRMRGQLVEASGPDGWRWRSSLTRKDTGAGACELFRVESIQIR
jgi:hypothetical protein